MPLAFGRTRRLRARHDFALAQRSGRRVGTKHFTLLVAAQGSAQASRLGLVVSRKVGNAVHRNRVKRLCRECFRTWPSFLPEGVDLVVIAREGASGLRLSEVRAEWQGIERLLHKRATEVLARKGAQPHVAGQP